MKALLSPELSRGAEIIFDPVGFICTPLYGIGLFPVKRGEPLVDFVHYIFPDFSCVGGSVDSRHITGDIVTHPDGGCVVRGVAAEPGILAAVCGSRFSGSGHIIFQAKSPSGAVGGGKCAF